MAKREQAAELQRSGRTDFQVRGEIQQLLNRAEHLDAVADQKGVLFYKQDSSSVFKGMAIIPIASLVVCFSIPSGTELV